MADRLHWKSLHQDRRPVQFADWHDRRAYRPHDHDFFELVVVTGGRGEHVSAAGCDRLVAGSVLLLVPGVWHEYRNGSGLEGFDCYFAKGILYHELAWVTDDPVLGRLLLRHVDSPFHRRPVLGRLDPRRLELVTGLLRDVCRLPIERVERRRTWVLGVLAALLGGFADAVRREVGRHAGPQVNPAHAELTRRAQALMAEDLTREWSLAGLAQAMSCGPGALTRAFRAVVGRSPMATYAHARMEHAAALLLRSDLAIGDIGAKVGIFDANYFARRFRAEIGMSASEYRRRFRFEA